MNILLLGGGVCLGASILESALARRRPVTVFNRDRARIRSPAGVQALVGDRATDRGQLTRGREADLSALRRGRATTRPTS